MGNAQIEVTLISVGLPYALDGVRGNRLGLSLWHLGAVTKEKKVEVENVSQRLNLTTAEFCKIPATTFLYQLLSF